MMSMTTRKQIARSNSDALAAFVQKKAEIDAMLARLQALSDDHFGYSPDEITWSHAEGLAHYARLLERITDYVAREAIADGYDSCAVTSVPAADVEGAVLDHVQKLLAVPELVARTWAAAKREGQDDITEREVTALLAEFATVWNELFPAEQARIVQLLVERVDVLEDALEVRIRAESLASLIAELRPRDERRAA